MCGLVAAFGATMDLTPALDALAHRGPDGRGTWHSHDHGVSLGHTRLALVDVDGGAQPLFNEEGSIVCIVNGELYGHRRIRAELESEGHRFSSRSDSEILLHLYEKHGLDCVEHLRGEFAFVLWDSHQQRLVAARDRFGVKPLCFARPTGTGRPLLLGSEAKAILALGHPARWDRRSLWHAAHHQYLPPGRSLFEGIEQLPAGHRLVADRRGIHIDRWWALRFPTCAPEGPEDAAQRLEATLAEAVRLRLQADVPVGFYLSGGLDSSAIVALAAQHIDRPACFSIAFEHAPYDERSAACDVARHVGADHHLVEVTQDTLVDLLPLAVERSEGLAINGQLPAKLALSQAAAAAGYKAVLVGEGADELLAGYPHLAMDYQAWTGGGGNGATSSIAAGVMVPTRDAPGIQAVTERLGFTPTFLRAKAAFGRRLSHLLAPALPAAFSDDDPFEMLLGGLPLNDLNGCNPVDKATWLWTHLALTGYILRTLGDGTEMAASIEGRVPFLDDQVADLLIHTRLDAKFRGREEKAILRDAVRRHLPPHIAARPKQPLLAPPLVLFSTAHARDFVHDTLDGGSSLYGRAEVQRWLATLASAPETERQAAEPVLLTLLTATLLQTHFGLT